ncbi:MAG: hypothetical protein QG646_743 [Euryarchaeota archaeon]|nr:hypothetical protein [Euryarchaeota archaeon]
MTLEKDLNWKLNNHCDPDCHEKDKQGMLVDMSIGG